MRTILVVAAVSALLAGCGGARSGGGLEVVASTNVYGDIAAQLGGSHVHVTSVLSDPNADPHLFEPDTRAGLDISRARVLIQNGAGYDDFMLKIERTAAGSDRTIVTAADVLGVHGHDANPHVWYDLPQVPRVAAAIAGALEAADPPHASAYRAALARFDASMKQLLTEVARDFARLAGKPVAYTEPLPGYLLAVLGLRNLAPAGFTRAIEDGTEPTPAAVAAMDALLGGHAVDVLLYDSQAASPITRRMRDTAVKRGVPVVGITETLPAGLDFQEWQRRQLRALERALAR
jgi:zinc/manganese transport system substrate-binding protein